MLSLAGEEGAACSRVLTDSHDIEQSKLRKELQVAMQQQGVMTLDKLS